MVVGLHAGTAHALRRGAVRDEGQVVVRDFLEQGLAPLRIVRIVRHPGVEQVRARQRNDVAAEHRRARVPGQRDAARHRFRGERHFKHAGLDLGQFSYAFWK